MNSELRAKYREEKMDLMNLTASFLLISPQFRNVSLHTNIT